MTVAPGSQEKDEVRLAILAIIAAALLAVLFVRLFFLQVVDAGASQVTATGNDIKTVFTAAPRGEILDRSGHVLVGNVSEPVINVDRQTAQHHPRMVSRLAILLGMSVSQLQRALANLQTSPYAPVPVLPDPSPEQILAVQEHPRLFPGVRATSEEVRTYSPMGVAAANLVGYVSPITAGELKVLAKDGYRSDSMIGQAGVEATYNSVLRGSAAVEKVAVTAAGNVLSVVSQTPARPGHNLRLTISGRIQEATVNALNQEIALRRTQNSRTTLSPYRADSGAMVVENPQNSALVALATSPSFDPSQFVGGITSANYAALTDPASHNPLEDRAVGGQYTPGSTFKLVTATAGLQSGVITPTSYFDDVGGGITVGHHFFANDGHQSFGEIQLPFAITVSDDAFFYHIGETLYTNPGPVGNNFLQKTAQAYGFTAPTAIALPGESAGYVLTPQQKAKLHKQYPKAYPYGSYYTGDAIESAIGQDDVAVTPLQLANAYAAFANGGTLYTPRVVQDYETSTGQVTHTYTSHMVRTIALTPAQHAAMLQGFVGVTANPNGTGYGSFGKYNYPIQVAGKTGTAQVVNGVSHYSSAYKQTTSVFTSFAPAANPQYVVDCFIPQGGYGASAAAPAVRQVYDVLFNQPILATPVSGY